MNLRCFYCQTPFTLGRAELLAALQRMDAENLHHYDAHCPRCKRANSISRERMELFFPNWRQVAEEQAAMPSAPEPAVPAPTPVVEESVSAPPAIPMAAPAKIEPAVSPTPKTEAPLARKPARKRAAPAKKKVAAPAVKKAKPAAKSKTKPASKSKAKSSAKKSAAKTKKK